MLLQCSFFLFLAIGLCSCHHTILFNTQKDLRITSISKGRKLTTHTLIKDLQDATSVTYMHNASLVCWVDDVAPQIECASFNTSHTWNRTVYAKMVFAGDGISSDWLTKKLYWTDSVSKRIEVVSLESRHRKVLYWEDIDQPRGIAVDSTEGLLFWTDWGDFPKIERASMDGNLDSRRIIVEEELYWPNSVTLDVPAKKLYWLDGKLCVIEVANYDGSERTVVIKQGLKYQFAYPFALALSDTKFYWTDWRTHSIYSIDRNVDNEHYADQILQTNDQVPIFGINVYDNRYQPYVPTPCDHNNGGCSHLCLLSSGPKRYSCACPTGIRLIDNRTCAKEEENLLFLVQRTEISRVSLDTPDHTNFELNLRGVKHAIGIDVDPVEEYFYWTDQDSLNISRAKFDGSHQETIISSDVFQPDGIAIDWIAKNLYWCDVSANRVEMARLNTTFRRVIVFEDLEQPRAVVVHPLQGWLFWSDWNEQKPKIERSELDGSNRMILVKTDILWPNGLALDFENKKLYFGDAKFDKIEVINMDGKERRVVVTEELVHMFGLTVLGDYLYWTDWSKRTLESAHIYLPRTNRTVILDQLPDVMGLKAVRRHTASGTNACATNNGGCAQFCFSKPDKRRVCGCQVEYELAANQEDCFMPDSYLMLLTNNRIRRISVRTTNSDVIPINDVKEISAIDVSPADRRVYWADSRMRTISSGFINGSHAEKIVSCGLGSPESVAIDWLAWNLYWTDVSLQRIEVIKLQGHYRRTLFWSKLKQPRNLVVDPRVGSMFWTEWEINGGWIMKAPMDGSSKRVIVEQVGRVNGMTIDYSQRNLYWTYQSADYGIIETSDASGLNRKLLLKQKSMEPFSITQSLSTDFLFWSKGSSVMQLRKDDTGSTTTTVYSDNNRILDVRAVDSSKQGGWNGCAVNNGDCKYLCLVRPGDFESPTTPVQCACPTHYTMRDNVCYPPENFLFFSQRNALYRLTTKSNECPDFPISIPGLKGVRAIEYDSATKNVYWIDGKTSAIRRSTENGLNNEVIMGPNADPHFWDIAIEPFNKILFWTSSMTNSINATRLDNSSVGCIFEGKHGESPRNLALHPERGLIFWTDGGQKPRIVQSRLNGEKQVIISTDGRLADALTVDRRSNLLYMAYDGRLYEFNIADRNRRFILEVGTEKVLSLAMTRSFLYWASRELSQVHRIERVTVNVNTVSDRTLIVEQSFHTSHAFHITDLIAVDPMDDSYPSHPCSTANNHGNCSHLCMPTVGKSVDLAECGCPVNLQLSEDGLTCSLPPLVVVEDQTDQNSCKLANSSMVCDGVWDCEDGSDEAWELCQNVRSILANNERYVENNNFSIQFLVAFAILISLAFVGIYYYVKQKLVDEADSKHDVAVMRPLASIATNACHSKISSMPSPSVSMVTGHPTSTGSVYQNALFTAISSSSSLIHCPLNPPPSPTTTTMQLDECSCSNFKIAEGLPTPCSTDVCNSEASYPSIKIINPLDGIGSNGTGSRSRRNQQQQQQQQQEQQRLTPVPWSSEKFIAELPTPYSTDVCDSEASYPSIKIINPPDGIGGRSRRYQQQPQQQQQQQQKQQQEQERLTPVRWSSEKFIAELPTPYSTDVCDSEASYPSIMIINPPDGIGNRSRRCQQQQ